MLYLGADTGNENVYNLLKSKRSDIYFTRDPHKYICTLGKKPSSAQYYIDDIDEVNFMLDRLRASTQKRKKNRSYSDLKDLEATPSPYEHDLAQAASIRQDYSTTNVRIL